MGLRTKALLLTAAVCVLTLAVATATQGESFRKFPLQVAINGGITPTKLPREELAPVSVLMSGKIATLDRSVPPKLEKIVLEINSEGVLDNRGLPTCSLNKLNSLSSAAAKKTCAGALVGHGNVTSRVYLPNQGAFASSGDLLAFNGRIHGRPAVLAQVASEAPLPLTYVIAFEIKKQGGRFGTAMIGTLPPIASEYGYISGFSLALSRNYISHGKQKSFASASCPAPKGFTLASFPFARASYVFAGGLKLGGVLVRDCKVRN
jgi:hypothetical protein